MLLHERKPSDLSSILYTPKIDACYDLQIYDLIEN